MEERGQGHNSLPWRPEESRSSVPSSLLLRDWLTRAFTRGRPSVLRACHVPGAAQRAQGPRVTRQRNSQRPPSPAEGRTTLLVRRKSDAGGDFLGAQTVKSSPASAADPGSPGRGGGSPGAGMATRSSILAWRIPRTEEPGEPHSIHGVPESQTRLSAHYGEMMGVGFWKIPRSLPLSETSTVLQGGEPREASSAPGKGGSEWGWGRG